MGLSTLNCFFFWDKDILFARQAFWYLENGFSFLPPLHINSGHPPVYSLILAGLWKIFNPHLAIGHLVMLPFAFGMVWQTYKFTKYFIKSDFVYLALVLVFIDTSVLAQFVIQTCDLFTLFFLFLCLNAVLYEKKSALLFGLIGLGISSSRGMISCVIVGIFHIYFLVEEEGFKNLFKRLFTVIPFYLPAIIILGAYLILHYIKTGWIGYDPENSNWAGCFERVDFYGFIRNSIIYIWRLIDFGRLFLWIFGIYFAYQFYKKKISIDRNIRILLVLVIISLIVYAPVMLLYKILNGHRYILSIFIVFTILISYILFEKTSNEKFKKGVFIVLLLGLISGNFWVYPDHIAKGWDATMAHVPYYFLRPKMIQYIDENEIPIESIGSTTPNDTKLKYIDLSGDERKFPRMDFSKDKYILYSNVYNMFTDEQLKELKEEWILVKEYRLIQVRITLYQRPENSTN